MQVLEHEHPLKLVDLKLKYSLIDKDDDDDDNNDDDLKIEEQFRCRCGRCRQEINEYHEYYYTCSSDSCGYSVHKSCAELRPIRTHISHNEHTIFLKLHRTWRCDICENYVELSYICDQCGSDVCIGCSIAPDETSIHHPCHTHPLVAFTEPILCKCRACGKTHKGTFYICTKCPRFSIHKDCAFLPKKLFIQDATNDEISHLHALTLFYSFPRQEQYAKYYPHCRVCDIYFINAKDQWVYKCDKCWFYAHVDCATSRKEPFMSIFSNSSRLMKTNKNFQESHNPDVVHLPFDDETNNILKHKFYKELESSPTLGSDDERNFLPHMSHEHPLILVDVSKPSFSSSMTLSISCHNPRKRIELLCNGCLRTVTDMPFYKCGNHDGDEQCNKFVLHEWCTRLPDHVENHPSHPNHTLNLLPKVPKKFMGVFRCRICHLLCNGFAYSCVNCDYHIDVNCTFMPKEITHTSHPNHLMRRVGSKPYPRYCRACYETFPNDGFAFSCDACDFDLHLVCALLLPGTVSHKIDKHNLKLSYFPIENHKSEYFCEICEEELNPNHWFYHCYECAQSIHCSCAPSILRSEEAIGDRRIFPTINIKLGGIYKIEDHPHPLSFVRPTKTDGWCIKCKDSAWQTWTQTIFKCLLCKFVIHFNCCKQFNNRQYY